MLNRIELENFKCFEVLDLECAPLTLLCGLNGMGKSSVFQGLLALRQSIESGNGPFPDMLLVNGELVNLGTARDVLFDDANDERIRIALSDGKIEMSYDVAFKHGDFRDHMVADRETATNVSPDWKDVPPIGGSLMYVDAERVGPRRLYRLAETFSRRGNVGTRCELALAHLVSRQDDGLRHDDPRVVGPGSRRMLSVLNHWLSGVSPGAHLQLEEIVDADAVFARFSFSRSGDVQSRAFRATNVGFGLSYTLPVLIALLSPRGTLCLIENPEAHLHPQGQVRLAELAVRATKAGVQVIAETHSDHFMDGVRVAVHEGHAEPNDVSFHYFERVDGKSRVVSPRIDSNGRLSEWPTGFFDQREKNLAKLIVPRQKNERNGT